MLYNCYTVNIQAPKTACVKLWCNAVQSQAGHVHKQLCCELPAAVLMMLPLADAQMDMHLNTLMILTNGPFSTHVLIKEYEGPHL